MAYYDSIFNNNSELGNKVRMPVNGHDLGINTVSNNGGTSNNGSISNNGSTSNNDDSDFNLSKLVGSDLVGNAENYDGSVGTRDSGNLDAEGKVQQILNEITQLQQLERDLYKEYDDGVSTLTSEQKRAIIDKINQISQIRVTMYQNLNNLFLNYQQTQSSLGTSLADQAIAIKVIENDLNEQKKKIDTINDEKNNKLRLVEINTYYGKTYESHSNIMKIIVYMCIPIIFFGILLRGGTIAPGIYTIVVSIVLVIGLYKIIKSLLYLSNRDNMNYDEYNWYFNKNNAPSIGTVQPSGTSSPWDVKPITCIGQSCCTEGTTYDSTLNKCVSNTCNTTESMTNMLFSNIKVKPYNEKNDACYGLV